MNENEILKKVQRDYTTIASDFAQTRQVAWPEFARFKKAYDEYLAEKKTAGADLSQVRLVDVGCGNGRLARYLNDEPIEYVGVDNNRELLELAEEKYGSSTSAEASSGGGLRTSFVNKGIMEMDFPEASFDIVCCIAMLHHLPTTEMQKHGLEKLLNIMKPEGFMMITVWNLWQKKYLPYVEETSQHALIPWGDGKNVNRFYYAFKEEEVEALLHEVGFLLVEKIPSAHNFAYICRNSVAPH